MKNIRYLTSETNILQQFADSLCRVKTITGDTLNQSSIDPHLISRKSFCKCYMP